MKLEELVIYQTANELAEKIWQMFPLWDSFSKDTIGKELLLSADSIATNIAVGFGRYNTKETQRYGYNARGSLFETKTWLKKAMTRNLISEQEYNDLIMDFDNYEIKLNNYIKSIGRNTQSSSSYNNRNRDNRDNRGNSMDYQPKDENLY